MSCPFDFCLQPGSLCWSNNNNSSHGSLQPIKQPAKIWNTGTKGTDPRNGCPIFGRVVPRTKFLGRYPEYLVSLIWTVSCRCLGYVILDYLFACGYIFLFTSAAGVNFPVSEYFSSTVHYMFFAFEVRKSPAFR